MIPGDQSIQGTRVLLPGGQIAPKNWIKLNIYTNSNCGLFVGTVHMYIYRIVAASQPAFGWPPDSMLITCTSPSLPHTWVPGQFNQYSSHVDGQPTIAHILSVLYIYLLITPNKPVPIHRTTVRYCTCGALMFYPCLFYPSDNVWRSRLADAPRCAHISIDFKPSWITQPI